MILKIIGIIFNKVLFGKVFMYKNKVILKNDMNKDVESILVNLDFC